MCRGGDNVDLVSALWRSVFFFGGLGNLNLLGFNVSIGINSFFCRRIEIDLKIESISEPIGGFGIDLVFVWGGELDSIILGGSILTCFLGGGCYLNSSLYIYIFHN